MVLARVLLNLHGDLCSAEMTACAILQEALVHVNADQAVLVYDGLILLAT